MSRAYSFAPGEYYHIYNRGVEKRLIFLNKDDYERFTNLLFFCNSSTAVNTSRQRKGLTFTDYLDRKGENIIDIGAYCLMPNHFHLLVKERSGRGISMFMQKLLTAYSMYFNVKNSRKGRLFESSYLSTHASYDQYLKYLFAYIHLNPIKLIEPKWKEVGLQNTERIKKYLSHYALSSFKDYTGETRDSGLILNKKEFPDYFPRPKDFTNSMFDWIKSNPEKV